MRGRTLLLVLGAILLSGCVSGPAGCVPPRSAGQVPVGAAPEGGFGADAVTVHILDETGRRMPGANVTVVWNREYIPAPDDEEDDVPAAPLLEFVDLRTDASGRAVAHLPAGRFFMVAATAPGYTEEWTSLHWPGASPLDVDLILHPATMTVTGTGQLAAGAGHGAQDRQWQPLLLPWPAPARTPGVGDAFTLDEPDWLDDRLVRVEAWMAWSTGMAEVAQLAIAMGWENATVEAARSEPPGTLGPQHNLSTWVAPEIDSFGPSESYADGVWVGPMHDGAFASLDGVPFEVGARAFLDHRAVATTECGVVFPASEQRPAAPGAAEHPHDESFSPVPGVPWPAIAVALGLLVSARRRWA